MATMQEYLDNSINNQTTSEKSQSSNKNSHIPYRLFVYREELRRYNKQAINLFKSKLHLTQELVSYSVDRITEYDMQELMNINQEISFTRKLKSRMARMKQKQKSCSDQVQLVERI